MRHAEQGWARRTVVLGVIEALLLVGLGTTIYVVVIHKHTTTASQTGTGVPAADFKPETWGYVGCSNTHDTIYGYHHSGSSADLFWPFQAGYRIEGQTVADWSNPNAPVWQLFDRMKQQYNGGNDPPVIWIQVCVNLAPGAPNGAPATYDDVAKVIENVHAQAPTSILYVSPLQSYDPPTLCYLMGPGAPEIPEMQQWLAKAVSAGLARPGPGVNGIANLGPLTKDNAFRDGCHPTGDPNHGPGTGADFLGGQLAQFFDNLPRT
jgi:hypothetical protein